MQGRLTLPARLRLRRKREFDAAYARGRRLNDGFFTVIATANEIGAPRLGLAVAVRAAGGAVARNRLRRIIRESFRLNQRSLPALDLVVSVRPQARAVPARALHASLAALWRKLGEAAPR
ncbi:MAG TPA: ribonuclease P protein component [Steroidobacteraceae bacterium]|nr:ribonuclease P protein component [Steroidobacteraceae bacterium]